MKRFLGGLIALVFMAVVASAHARADNDAKRIKAIVGGGDSHMMDGAKLMYESEKTQGAKADQLKKKAGREFEDGIKAYRKAMDELGRAALRDAAKLEYLWPMYYNMAAARSLQGRKAEAIDHLYQMMSAGFDLWYQLNKERDFDNIRNEPAYKNIVRLSKDTKFVRDLLFEKLNQKEILFPFDFAVTTLDGRKLALSDLKGKVVIVNFWGTWYEPWETELVTLKQLRKGFDGRAEVVGLAWQRGLGEAEARASLEKAVKSLNIAYPVAAIDKALTQKIPEFATYPTTLFIDKAGRVRFKSFGFLDHASHWMVTRLLDMEEPE